MKIDNIGFKKVQILFWTFWWAIALWTDIVGGLAHLGTLHASWAPDSNYPFLLTSLKMYNAPGWLVSFFFLSIITWSALATSLFIWASVGMRLPIAKWKRRVEIAFIVSLSFWLAFFIADQAVMKFDLEENHMVQGGFQLLSFLSFYLLPDSDAKT